MGLAQGREETLETEAIAGEMLSYDNRSRQKNSRQIQP